MVCRNRGVLAISLPDEHFQNPFMKSMIGFSATIVLACLCSSLARPNGVFGAKLTTHLV
jgi:hypothetical protein